MSLIVSRTPFRISFAGGGTDLPSFYRREQGAVLSTTIDKYVYVMVNRRTPPFGNGIRLSCTPLGSVGGDHGEGDPFLRRIRISYSSTENVQKVDEVEHPIVREALRLLEIQDPIDISTIADIPAGTGLGSSSTFAVALLHALHEFKGERVTPAQLVVEAAHIEIDVLQRPMGKQDHCAAAFGGLNLFTFLPDEDVKVHTLASGLSVQERLFPYLMLFYTGVCRHSSDILTEQKANTEHRHAELVGMREHAHQLERLVLDGFSPSAFGRVLHDTWMYKRTLASGITNEFIDQWYERARAAGAWGGKLCGAGGGGFLLLVAEPQARAAIKAQLAELPELPIRFEPCGSQILLR